MKSDGGNNSLLGSIASISKRERWGKRQEQEQVKKTSEKRKFGRERDGRKETKLKDEVGIEVEEKERWATG